MSDKVIKLVRGADRTFLVQINDRNGEALPVTGYTITSALRDTEKDSTANGDTITSLTGDTGAVWAKGLVAVTYTDTQTAALTLGRMRLETKLVDGSSLVDKAISEEIIEVVDGVL